METLCLLLITDDVLDLNQIEHNVRECLEPSPFLELEIKKRNVKYRNRKYFEVTIPSYSDKVFREHFRMNRETFQKLENLVGQHMRQNQNYSVPLRQKILFTLWLLCKSESFLAAGDRFGLPSSSGHKVFREITQQLSNFLGIFVQWPDNKRKKLSKKTFKIRSRGFPGVVGVLDGCHIACKPFGNSNHYYNKKGVHSIILQGICDHNLRFIDVFIGTPGRMYNSKVFRSSKVYRELMNVNNSLLNYNEHIVAGPAYPLLNNLLTPLRDTGHLTRGERSYNIKLGSIRSTIDRAFTILKGKFRRLKYLDVHEPHFANQIIAATCVLHNFIIDSRQNNDDVQQGDTEDLDDSDDDLQFSEEFMNDADGRTKRDIIVTIMNG